MGRESDYPSHSEWEAKYWGTLAVQAQLRFTFARRYFFSHSGKHRAPGPLPLLRLCQAGAPLSFPLGSRAWLGLVSETLFLFHTSFGQLGLKVQKPMCVRTALPAAPGAVGGTAAPFYLFSRE